MFYEYELIEIQNKIIKNKKDIFDAYWNLEFSSLFYISSDTSSELGLSWKLSN